MSAEPKQEALNFGRLYTVTDSARLVYRKLNDAVDVVGILTAAGACGIDRGDLRRGLDRDKRYVAVEHAMAIAALAGPDFYRAIGNAFVAPASLKITDEVPMTDREYRIRSEATLARHGELGAVIASEITGGRR